MEVKIIQIKLESKTFNENNVNDIGELALRVYRMNRAEVNERFIKVNLEKAVNCLKMLNHTEFKSVKALQLLILIRNLTCKSAQYVNTDDMIDWILSIDTHEVLTDLLHYYANINDETYSFREALIGITLGAILNITLREKVVVENIQSGVFTLALDLLSKEDLLSEQKLHNFDSICLHDIIIKFLYVNTQESAIEELIKQNVVDKLVKHNSKLNTAVNSYGHEHESLKVLSLYIAATLKFITARS